MNLWNNTPGLCEEIPAVTPYLPEQKRSDAAIVIFPGGGYCGRAPHEGQGYAEFFAANGIAAFVIDYRVSPHRFPLELLDARRAVRWVRAHAEQYGIDKNKIAVIGSSAGGHLAAMLSTYQGSIDHENADEIDTEDYLPNAQILCYPVICAPDSGVAHVGSYANLLGERFEELQQAVDPERNVSDSTPPAFIWHTADDAVVPMQNSLRYAAALRAHNVSVELHIFPHGPHGLGLRPDVPHVTQWSTLLLNWLRQLGWL